MNLYRVTFGQKYRREPHPTAPWVSPDGWLDVHAADEMTARELTVSLLGRHWCDLYSADDLRDDSPWYSAGSLASLAPAAGQVPRLECPWWLPIQTVLDPPGYLAYQCIERPEGHHGDHVTYQYTELGAREYRWPSPDLTV